MFGCDKYDIKPDLVSTAKVKSGYFRDSTQLV